ncbi:hypothetical protein B0H14DRAFT_2814466 [Mycena olivaceomarginata]|nr:hypothetical protein B0H14DRAFT_2814466 [Mycena olivaceomarginata]
MNCETAFTRRIPGGLGERTVERTADRGESRISLSDEPHLRLALIIESHKYWSVLVPWSSCSVNSACFPSSLTLGLAEYWRNSGAILLWSPSALPTTTMTPKPKPNTPVYAAPRAVHSNAPASPCLLSRRPHSHLTPRTYHTDISPSTPRVPLDDAHMYAATQFYEAQGRGVSELQRRREVRTLTFSSFFLVSFFRPPSAPAPTPCTPRADTHPRSVASGESVCVAAYTIHELRPDEPTPPRSSTAQSGCTAADSPV